LTNLTAIAVNNERLRSNYNLHESLDEPVQRLLNALEPGTKVPVHRHLHTDETYILIKGKLEVFFYNEMKEIINTFHLDPLNGNYGLSIPAGQWHGLNSLENGTVILEIKEGPYKPLDHSDVMSF
jgi:cupin fold WbuC family metalloprotein